MSKAAIILAALSGLMKGYGDSRQAAADRKLKEQEMADKRADRLADANKPTDAIRNYLQLLKIKESGGSPADQMAFAGLARGSAPMQYQIDPNAFLNAQAAGKKWGPRAAGPGGGGGQVAVRRPRPSGGGGGLAGAAPAPKRYNPKTDSFE